MFWNISIFIFLTLYSTIFIFWQVLSLISAWIDSNHVELTQNKYKLQLKPDSLLVTIRRP